VETVLDLRVAHTAPCKQVTRLVEIRKKPLDDPESANRAVRFSVLGPFELDLDQTDLPRKARALLAYLVMKQGVSLTREALAGMFWGDRAEEQARASLRQTLSLIRKTLGTQSDHLLVASRESVTISPQAVDLDLNEFDRLAESDEIAALKDAVALVRGDLLEDLMIDAPPFEQWLVTEREALRRKAMGCFRKLVPLLESAGMCDEAIAYSQMQLSLDQVDEEAHRSLIRLYTATGRTDAALEQFNRCRRDLRDRLSVEPDVRTVELAGQVRAMRSKTRSATNELTARQTSSDDALIIILAWTGADEQESLIEALVHRHGGDMLSKHLGTNLAQFFDPAKALLAAMEIRNTQDDNAFANSPTPSVGLHLAKRLEGRGKPDTPGIDIAYQICTGAQPREVRVSQGFFECARRTSPCTFVEAGTLLGSPPVPVFRVSGSIARHPFQANHIHEQPVVPRRENSVAVKPIRLAGADSGEEYLAEGLTEDLILELGRMPGLFVSSRTTTPVIGMRDVAEIGDALGVRFVLSGSLRRGGETVHLNLTLTKTEDGQIVWSERITCLFVDLLDMVEDIAARVAGTVGARVEREALATARLKRPESMTAYDHYMRGVWHHRMGAVTSEHSRQAVDWFKRAIEIDPTFARPRAALACAWSDLPDCDNEHCAALVEEALQFDPTDPEVHRILGAISLYKGDITAARHHTERATQMAPNDAYLLARSAAFFTFVGEPETALEKLDRAEQLDPFLPVYAVEERLIAEYGLGHFDAALSEASRLPFQSRRSRYYSAACFVALGRLDDAKTKMREALTADPELSVSYVLGQEKYADKAVLENLLDRLFRAGLSRAA
jgi:adenylate cyclase